MSTSTTSQQTEPSGQRSHFGVDTDMQEGREVVQIQDQYSDYPRSEKTYEDYWHDQAGRMMSQDQNAAFRYATPEVQEQMVTECVTRLQRFEEIALSDCEPNDPRLKEYEDLASGVYEATLKDKMVRSVLLSDHLKRNGFNTLAKHPTQSERAVERRNRESLGLEEAKQFKLKWQKEYQDHKYSFALESEASKNIDPKRWPTLLAHPTENAAEAESQRLTVTPLAQFDAEYERELAELRETGLRVLRD